jgi:hypothetical protein
VETDERLCNNNNSSSNNKRNEKEILSVLNGKPAGGFEQHETTVRVLTDRSRPVSFSLSCVCLVSSSLSIPSPSLYVLRLQYGYMPALCVYSLLLSFSLSVYRIKEDTHIHS